MAAMQTRATTHTAPTRAEAASLGIWCAYTGALHVPALLDGLSITSDVRVEETPTGFSVSSSSGGGGVVQVTVPEEERDDWLTQRERWMGNVKLWPHIQATRSTNWLGLATAPPPPQELQSPSTKPLAAGEMER